MGTNAVTRGPVSTTVATNVQAIRKRRNMSQQDLARALAELGRPMQPSAIAKIEAGDRRVDVDDLAALAVALNVSVARLMVPDAAVDEDVNVVPAFAVPMWSAWNWATARRSLHRRDDDLRDPALAERDLAWEVERPAWQRISDQYPLASALRHLSWTVETGIRNTAGAAGRPSAKEIAKHSMSLVRSAAEALVREAERVESEGRVDG